MLMILALHASCDMEKEKIQIAKTESCIMFADTEMDQVGKSNWKCTFDEVHILALTLWIHFSKPEVSPWPLKPSCKDL